MEERRRSKRYLVHEDVYVYRAKRVGKIRNISLTGLLCNCVHHSDCSPVEFEIFCPRSSVCLEALPYNIVASKKIEIPPHFVRQCHVQFASLNTDKVLSLQNFIEKYTLKD